MSQGSWLGGGVEEELDEDVDGDVDGELEELLTPPVHATPFMVNAVGIGLLLLFHAPLNPKLVEPPLASAPLYDMLAALTCAPLWVTVAFQACDTCWPAPNDQPTVQEDTGSPRLVRVTFAPNPPPHCEVIEYATEQPAPAACAVMFDSATPAPTRAADAPTASAARDLDLFILSPLLALTTWMGPRERLG
jgi:hypothetical protein